jgi:hypothetical protein
MSYVTQSSSLASDLLLQLSELATELGPKADSFRNSLDHSCVFAHPFAWYSSPSFGRNIHPHRTRTVGEARAAFLPVVVPQLLSPIIFKPL